MTIGEEARARREAARRLGKFGEQARVESEGTLPAETTDADAVGRSGRPAGSRITEFQAEVGQAFFTLPESDGFFVAGGAALILNGVVDRDTDDLDAFTARGDVQRAADAFEAEARRRGWDATGERKGDYFARIIVARDGQSMKVELARDSPPLNALHVTFLGPTIDSEDSVGNKMLALFGRAAPRDFTDIFDAAQRLGKPRLLELAAERDAGFDPHIFAQMLEMLPRTRDAELPCAPKKVPAVREFFAQWVRELDPTRSAR